MTVLTGLPRRRGTQGMTMLTVVAGARTIGGTQIVIEEGGARLLVDCGLVHDPAGDPFAYVRRRPGRVLADLLALGRAPFIPGLYAPSTLSATLSASPLPRLDGPLAVALSNAHLDHSGLACFVEPAVPVYAAQGTARLLPVLAAQEKALAPFTRPITALADGGTFTVGPLRVQMLVVDHDVGGTAGLLIETARGVIAYAGSLRLHGAAHHRTLAFARAARDAGTRLLILEGTRLGVPSAAEGPAATEVAREADLAPAIVDALHDAGDRLALILLAPQNGERVEALAHELAAAGRLLVLDRPALALAVAALGHPLAAPHAVYAMGRSGSPATSETVRPGPGSAPRLVTTEDIAADPGAFVLHLPFESFAHLLDLAEATRGGLLLAVNGVPAGPSDPAWTHLEHWTAFLGLRLVEIGCSGHATPDDLAAIASLTGAPRVMPVHSTAPHLLPVHPEHLVLPQQGRRYRVEQLAP